jgi:hypothetical protein
MANQLIFEISKHSLSMGQPRKLEYPTRLNDAQFKRCWAVANTFIKKNGRIKNSQLREIADIGYDQAIDFFSRAVDEQRLKRLGVASATHYVLHK